MKDVFAAYPELICIDATYKLLELRFPVYILLVEDGNGQSEIAAVFLMLEETEESMSKMINIFKNNNPNWMSIRVLMGDKDLTQRDVLAQAFPSANLLICLFHTFRSFRREITAERMGITSGQRVMCLEILQQLAYSTSEIKYQEIYSRFCDIAPPTVCEYFNNNWHPIRQQWVMGMIYTTGNFLNRTNNRLESLNAKLKSVISRYSSLEQFVDNFF
jgi:zinc finger SWIM domain-containing protein 3